MKFILKLIYFFQTLIINQISIVSFFIFYIYILYKNINRVESNFIRLNQEWIYRISFNETRNDIPLLKILIKKKKFQYLNDSTKPKDLKIKERDVNETIVYFKLR